LAAFDCQPETMDKIIPVNTPLLDGNEKHYLALCVDSGWISSEGPLVRRFEEQFAARVRRRYGIAVCNGSAALDTAVAAMGLGRGDEVVLPTFTIISCGAAIVRAGAIPVVVDADPATWNLDPSKVEAQITPRTRAILAAHIYGLPVNMTPLMALTAKHGLRLIEDAAQAHAQTCDGRPCGSFGEISTFSFYANKHLTTGEGGMILTDDSALAERCRSLRNLCFQPNRRFVHEELGWNFRLSSLQAAVGLAQLETLDRHLERKRAVGQCYARLLRDLPDVQLPLARTPYAENAYWVYGLVLGDSFPCDAQLAMARLAERGIGTRPFFWPLHEQPVFRKMGLFDGICCPVAERLARRGFYLPSGLGLSTDDIERVAAEVSAVVRWARSLRPP
jgi:perosamine synthetase